MSTQKQKLRKAAQIGILAAAVGMIIFASQDWTDGEGPAKPASSRTAMPDLALPKLGGGSWKLSEHRGQVVLVNFWATWCPPCRQETPGLIDLAHHYSPRGLVIAGVSLDEGGAAPVQSFVHEFNVPYTILVPPPDSPYVAGIQSLPTSILIDRTGRVAKTYMGAVREATLAKDVERLLAESSVGKPESTT